VRAITSGSACTALRSENRAVVRCPGVIDQDSAHCFRRGGEEMALAVEVLIADQSQIRFVNEGSGIECVAGCFGGHTSSGELPQLVVDERKQFIRGLMVAGLGDFKQTGHIGHNA
jgi:hypothetical protein